MSAEHKGSFVTDVPLEDEIPLAQLPDVPSWSENYCGHGYDFQRNVGYWYHIGRWIRDPTMWRERMCVLLPDGSMRLTQTFGRGDCQRGPSGSVLRLECQEPGRSWRVLFHGPMRSSSVADLMHAPLPDPEDLPLVDVDLAFTGTVPMWYFDQRESTTWGKWHVEQQGRVTGTIRTDAGNLEFDGFGYSDHSRGPRKLSAVRGNCWIQSQFDNGDFLAIFQMWHEGDDDNSPLLGEARYVRGETIVPARIVESPRLFHLDAMLDPCRLVVEVEGEILEWECSPVAAFAHTLNGFYSHAMWGAMIGRPGWPQTVVNQPTLFTSSSMRGEGWMERCVYRHEDIYDDAVLLARLKRNRGS